MKCEDEGNTARTEKRGTCETEVPRGELKPPTEHSFIPIHRVNHLGFGPEKHRIVEKQGWAGGHLDQPLLKAGSSLTKPPWTSLCLICFKTL